VNNDDYIIDLVGNSAANTISDAGSVDDGVLLSPPLPSKPNKQRCHSTIPQEQLYPKCKDYKFNSHCMLHLCKTCCCASTDKCALTDHAKGKVEACQSYASSLLNETTNSNGQVELLGIRE
jgi:hypothetical protein